LRFGLDQTGQHFTNPVAANYCFAGLGYEAGLRFIEGHDRVEITGVEVLLENTRPILWLMGDIVDFLALGSGHWCVDKVPNHGNDHFRDFALFFDEKLTTPNCICKSSSLAAVTSPI
jgi:hypothetical protein